MHRNRRHQTDSAHQRNNGRYNGPRVEFNKIIPNKLSKILIPDPGEIKLSSKPIKHYDIEQFMKLKSTLNAKKSEMDIISIDKQKGEEFANLLNTLRITNQLRYDMQDVYNGQHVTRAWLKFYELFVHFGLVERHTEHNGKLRIFFNAELPGAGICSINHLMKTYHSNIDYTWVANSLVLGDTVDEKINALGDQYGIWKHNKDNWLMTVESVNNGDSIRDADAALSCNDAALSCNDGDVTKPSNIMYMKTHIGEKADIVTHDAGIDVSYVIADIDDQTGFNTQEYKNMKIHFGCALTAFETMKIGGAFMAKQYTFFETFTINLILIYASMFDKFYICKPITSGHSNSEIYLIGLGFKGMTEKQSKIFHNRLNNWNINPFITEAELNKHANSLAEIERYCRLRNTEQIQFINENIDIFNTITAHSAQKMGAVRSYMRNIHRTFANNWIELYKPRKITDNDKVPDSEFNELNTSGINH